MDRWDKFKKKGYVTQFGEDSINIGTFTYRMLGFKVWHEYSSY